MARSTRPVPACSPLARGWSPSVLAPIASVVVLVTGILFLIAYRNRYIAPGRDAVQFRTLWGREKSIRYDDITSYQGTVGGARPHLTVRAGRERLRVNPSFYDLSVLYAAIEERERAGR